MKKKSSSIIVREDGSIVSTLCESHIIRASHPLYGELDALCFASKNLYNSGLYHIRQHFFNTGKYLNYNEIQRLFQNTNQPDYRGLPAKVSQQILRVLDKNFSSFFGSLKSPKVKKPRIPRYKHKTEGRNICVYTAQAVSKAEMNRGRLKLSGTNVTLPTRVRFVDLQQVRIVPICGAYKIEVIYKHVVKSPAYPSVERVAALDLGLANLATVAFSDLGMKPIYIKGGILKSINQFYNKRRAELQSYLQNGKKTSKRINKMTLKRNCKIQDYLHKMSTKLVNHLVSNDVGVLAVGYNPGWKQEINLGKKTNQNFVSVPFKKFVDYLRYKAEMQGIAVVLQEESYTSKCSFLDLEEVCAQEAYKGRRTRRGLFQSSCGRVINADVNGAFNILRKAFPGVFFTNGIEGVVVHPVRLK